MGTRVGVDGDGVIVCVTGDTCDCVTSDTCDHVLWFYHMPTILPHFRPLDGVRYPPTDVRSEELLAGVLRARWNNGQESGHCHALVLEFGDRWVIEHYERVLRTC